MELAGECRCWGQVALATQSPTEKTGIGQRQEGECGGVDFACESNSPEAQTLEQKRSQHVGGTAASLWGPVGVTGRTLGFPE